MILEPVSIATRGYSVLEPITVATMGYVYDVFTVYPEGGFTFSGAGDFTRVANQVPAGGISFGGAASISFVPGSGGALRRLWYRLGLGF